MWSLIISVTDNRPALTITSPNGEYRPTVAEALQAVDFARNQILAMQLPVTVTDSEE